MFEHKSEKLLPVSTFARRMVVSFLLLVAVLLVALGLGVLGYHYFAGLTWLDSILNASVILTGMGPIAPMVSDSAKWFASAYALFSGVIFLSSIGLLLAPVFTGFCTSFISMRTITQVSEIAHRRR
jgi:hypothetical protein